MEEIRQEFTGPVGDVAGRDIVNHNYTQGRLLTKAERVELHKLVQRLENDFGEPGWQTWKFLHRTIGVENIEVMCLAHRDQAEAILNLLLERARLQTELEDKTDEFEQSGKALTTLTERNSLLAAQLKQAQQAATALHQKMSAIKPAESCAKCEAATEVIAATRRRLLFASAVAVLGIAGAAFFAYQSRGQAKAACEFGGKPYTIGSIIDNQDASDIECVTSGKGQPLQWRAIGPRPSEHKSTRPNTLRQVR